MFDRILVPLDGSPFAEQALAPAMQLARALHARVLLLRSIQPVYSVVPVAAGEYEWLWPDSVREDHRHEVEDYLESVRRQVACPECTIHTAVHDGDPAGVIVDAVADAGVNLVVISTHGESGVRRAVFGSVTERVLHSVACPVLVTRTKQPIRRILVPLDGSELSELALPPALELAAGFGARLVLLRVNELLAVNPLDVAMSWEWDVVEPEQRIVGERRQAAEAYLREIVLRFGLSPADVQTIVLDGSPVDRIQEFARLYDVDLIAMSTHGRTGLRRWLYGSVASKVLRGTERSMLIVRPSADVLH